MQNPLVQREVFEVLRPILAPCELLRLGCAGQVDRASLSGEFLRAIELLAPKLQASDPEQKLVTVLKAVSNAVRDEIDLRDLQAYCNLYIALEAMSGEIFAAIEMYELQTGLQKTRMELIQSLIDRFGYERYLEIGTRHDECFAAVNVRYKVGVDPEQGGTLRLTSDQYFAEHSENFDIIFIDGLHEAVQVHRDIANSLKVLSPGGVIVMHDCNPLFESRQVVPPLIRSWNGDTWRAFVHYRSVPDLDMAVTNFDQGCGVIRVRTNSAPIELSKPYDQLGWPDLVANRPSWLNVKTWDEVHAWV